MSLQVTARPHVQIAHVLFLDVVGYSKLLINEQEQTQLELNEMVRGTEQFRTAEAEGKLTRLPTGDGMALVFFTTPEAPVQCALEISDALRSHPRLKVRMGVHSGPISSTMDVNNQTNIAGSAINIAERIMSCGDGGHILLSKRVADDLGQYAEWQDNLHDLGAVQVKHGVTLEIYNLYTEELGNPELPAKIREASTATPTSPTAAAAHGFFDEIRRRKVYRVALAYTIAAGGIIQLASAAFPAWELPNWSLRLIIVLLLAGFPIALIFAWIFDITPAGIQRTSAIQPQPLPKPQRRRNLITLAATGAVVAIAAGFFLLPRGSARTVDKSIAVLPFQNLSEEKENAFFADGIQDDILTNLAKIGDLKVISRTSVMPYREKQRSVREIGKALGVSAILEGSVRRSGNRVRINVQLIDATNDEHIWAEDYDRDLTDMFAIQTDLAQNIAKELQAKLSPTEKAQLARKPTENAEAYLAFVQGRDLQSHVEDFEKRKQSAQLYQRAVQLDPEFALAWARYSQLQSWRFHSNDPIPHLREDAIKMAERALQLQPDLTEAHLARGFAYYYCENNFDEALREFGVAQQGLPNDSETFLAIGAIQRRQGRWTESTANLQKAASLDPKSTWPLQNLFFNYQMTRDFAAAGKTVDRALAMEPDSLSLWSLKARLAILEKGDCSVAEELLSKFANQSLQGGQLEHFVQIQVSTLTFQRKFAEALRVVENVQEDKMADKPALRVQKYLATGICKNMTNDSAGARQVLLKARQSAQAMVNQTPDNPDYRIQFAEALAWLGEKEASAAETQKAMDLRPVNKDAFNGAEIAGQAAGIFAIIGEQDRAVGLLDDLLARPSDITVEVLKLDPAWDPLRDNRRFAELLAKHGAKT